MFNLNYYKITVYGEMMQQGFEPKIDADFIKLEKVKLLGTLLFPNFLIPLLF